MLLGSDEYILDESQELNILADKKRAIQLAFKRFNLENVDFIAVQLGISGKTLFRYLDYFGLRGLIGENRKNLREYKKNKLKQK